MAFFFIESSQRKVQYDCHFQEEKRVREALRRHKRESGPGGNNHVCMLNVQVPRLNLATKTALYPPILYFVKQREILRWLLYSTTSAREILEGYIYIPKDFLGRITMR